eukprot:IDg4994t1
MAEISDDLNLDTEVFDVDIEKDIKIKMTYEFPVMLIRQITGKYSHLINHYAETRLESYVSSQYMFEDLAEVAYADFEKWDEKDFKRLEQQVQRNLRDHLYYNGLVVGKKSGLAISKALYECLKNPDSIPISRDREIMFCDIRPKTGANTNSDKPRTNLPANATCDSNATSKCGTRHRPSVQRLQSSGKLVDVTKCVKREMVYHGLPDEDFDGKVAHFKFALELTRIDDEADKLTAVPLFLGGQAALTFRTSIRNVASTLEEAIELLRKTFLSEEARRANDTVWDAISFKSIKTSFGTKTNRDTLRKLFEEIERLRTCTSHSAKANEETTAYITRAKLLSSVSGIECFQYVRSNPPEDYLRLRSSLYDAATQADTNGLSLSIKSSEKANHVSFVTDRRFQGNKRNRGRHKGYSGRGSKSQPRYAGGDTICWVCGKDGCHSTKHPKEERSNRRNQLRSYMTEALASSEEEIDGERNESEDDGADPQEEVASFITTLQVGSFLMRKGANPAEAHEFLGIALDTCCTHYCTSSKEQYLAYCSFTGQRAELKSSNVKFNTSAGIVESIGTAVVHIPFGKLLHLLRVEVHVFDYPSTAPMLLCYEVMKSQKWNMMIPQRRLQSAMHPDLYVKYEEIDGLPVYRWHPKQNSTIIDETSASLYTVQQLRNMHRRTGHQAPNRLMKILEAIPRKEELPPDTRAMLQRIAKSCKACQILAKPPERFRFIVHDESRFNHELIVDIMKLSDGNVLHVMCVGTKYQLGCFLSNMTSQECWNAIRKCWINVLSGSPDIIKADAGRQFESKLFKDSAKSMGIHVEIIPTEAHHKIGLLERYHKVLRDVYEKLKLDDSSMSKELRLSNAFRCVNDSAGFDGIVPTLLVFGSFPKLHADIDTIAPTTIERVKSINSARKLATELINEERMRRAAKNGPAANIELIEAVKRLTRNAPVLVYREKTGWEGPLDFLAADGHGAWVKNNKGNEIRVSLHVIKPYVPEQWVLFSKIKDPIFEKPRQDELDELFKRKAIHLVPIEETTGHRVYHGIWLDKVKRDGQAKSRLVICATDDYLDALTYSLTIQRLSTRLGFAYAASRTDFFASCRDVTKALKVVQPIYGLPESPLNWYTTYTAHYKNQLELKSMPHDPCMLMKYSETAPCEGIVMLQVDDSTTFGTKEFHRKEEKASARFENHGATFLSEIPVMHNGALISFDKGIYTLNQTQNVKRIKPIPENIGDEDGYKFLRSQNATAAYPASLTRPDLLCFTSKFAQVTQKTYSNRIRRRFNQFVEMCQKNDCVPLNFVALNMDTVHVAVFTDASFSTTEENKSQLGIVVLLRDASGCCNLVYASSVKARRRARSVLGAEMFALLDGFDCGYVVRELLERMLGRKADLHILTDSRSAYHISTSLITTKEKRLMLDVHLLREAYERREITKITWISSNCNVADCLTKLKHNNSILQMLKSNRIAISCEGWVDRDILPIHAITASNDPEQVKTFNHCLYRWKKTQQQNSATAEIKENSLSHLSLSKEKIAE